MGIGQLVLTVVTAVAAITAAALSWWAGHQSTGQRERQGRREEWWRRFQWAIELAMSDSERKSQVGVALLDALANSSLATADEVAATSAVNDPIVRRSLTPSDQQEDDGGHDGDG